MHVVPADVLSPTSNSSTVNCVQAYSSEAQVNTFLANLASELSMIAEQPTAIFKSQAVDPVESLGQALEVLHGTLETLSDVQTRATRHVTFLAVRLPTTCLWSRRQCGYAQSLTGVAFKPYKHRVSMLRLERHLSVVPAQVPSFIALQLASSGRGC